MPDAMDQVQEATLQRVDDALAAHAAKRTVGLAECEDCGEAISTLRQSLGARCCMFHQQQLERRGRR